MKIITLIKDGGGCLRLDVTRAPDLLRREISLATGRAHLCWCGLPPEGMAARAVVSEVERRLTRADGSGGLLAAPVCLVIRYLLLVTLVEPVVRVYRRKLAGLLRRLRWRLRAVLARIASFGADR